MTTILITGAYGQLGSELGELREDFPQYRFVLVDRKELDITSAAAVQTVFDALKPQFCVNCAAYTAVDKAEGEEELVVAINATGVKNLAAAASQHGTRFIHISTDYVFDGTATAPYTEEDNPSPVNLYGRSKLQGEVEAIQEDKDAVIIRTSWVYSAYGNNFVKTMIRLMGAKPELNVVSDQQGPPTYAADLARTIMHIIQHATWHPGIYHYTNDGLITWFRFAQAIKELTASPCIIHPVTTQQYPTPAKRPAYSGLSKSKIKSVYGLPERPWQDSLKRCVEKLLA